LQEKLNEINIELENKSFLIYKERIKIAKIFKKKLIKIFKNLSWINFFKIDIKLNENNFL